MAKQTSTEVKAFLIQQLDKSLECFKIGCAELEKGATIFHALAKEHSCVWDVIANEYNPHQQQQFLALDKIGKGKVLAELILCMTPGATRLLKAPISVQRALVKTPVQLVTFQDGKRCVVDKLVTSMTSPEVNLVLDDAHQVRSTADQIAKLEVPRQRTSPTKRCSERYQISEDGETIKFFADTVFTFSQLVAFMDRMADLGKAGLAQKYAPAGHRQTRASA